MQRGDDAFLLSLWSTLPVSLLSVYSKAQRCVIAFAVAKTEAHDVVPPSSLAVGELERAYRLVGTLALVVESYQVRLLSLSHNLELGRQL